MRILVVIPSISRAGGGVSEVARLASMAVADEGHDVRVATLYDAFFSEDLQGWAPLPIRAYRSIGPKNFGFSPGLFLAVVRSRADVIHVHGMWMFHCAAVLAWSLVRGGRYVVTPHGMLERWIRQRSPFLKQIVSALFHDRFLRRTSCFQVLTDKEVGDLTEVIGSAPVRLVPNYVNLDSVPDHSAPPTWWQPQFSGRDVFLYFGRIHEKKGCLELCQAWQEACERSPHFHKRSILVFCGWVDGLANFEARISGLHGKFGNVYFAGPQYGAAKESTLAAASFVLLPSKSEGLPMAVLEAWSYAKPVLMTKECNLSAAFGYGAAIEIQSSSSSIADVLLAASELEFEDRAELGRKGRKYVEANFSKNVVIDKLTTLYVDVTMANIAAPANDLAAHK